MTCFKKKNIHDEERVLGIILVLEDFQSIISLDALKLALKKSMRASHDEQGINKLPPYGLFE